MSRLPALPPISPAGTSLGTGEAAVAKASAAPPPTAPVEAPRLIASAISQLDNAVAVPINGSDMSLDHESLTG